MENDFKILQRAISNYILPLLSLPQNTFVAYQYEKMKKNKNYFYKKNTNYYFFKTDQICEVNEFFTCKINDLQENIKFEETLVNKMYRQILSAFNKAISFDEQISLNQFYRICDCYYETGICNYFYGNDKFATNTVADTVQGLLNSIIRWSSKKDEGDNIFLSFILDKEKRNINVEAIKEYTTFLENHQASALISEADVAIEFTDDGYKLNCFENSGENTENLSKDDLEKEEKRLCFVPLSLYPLAKYCAKYKKIGLVLNKEKDILFISDKSIVFARREGEWTTFNFPAFFSLFRVFENPPSIDLIRHIFLSCVDVAFNHSGGGIVVVSKEIETKSLHKYINDYDLLKKPIEVIIQSDEEQMKINRCRVFKNLAKENKFTEINPKIRSELIGIDGAMIINAEGEVLAIGAILKGSDESGSGARTSALKGISKKEPKNCLAIKISADGYISVYIAGMEEIKIR